MTHEELFGRSRDGTYMALPKVLAAAPNQIITPYAKDVWASLAERLGENPDSWPSYDRIAYDTGGSRDGAIDAVKDLEVLGLLIKVSRQISNDLNDTNLYTVVIPPELLELEARLLDKLGNKRKVVVGNDYIQAFEIIIQRVATAESIQSDAHKAVIKRIQRLKSPFPRTRTRAPKGKKPVALPNGVPDVVVPDHYPSGSRPLPVVVPDHYPSGSRPLPVVVPDHYPSGSRPLPVVVPDHYGSGSRPPEQPKKQPNKQPKTITESQPPNLTLAFGEESKGDSAPSTTIGLASQASGPAAPDPLPAAPGGRDGGYDDSTQEQQNSLQSGSPSSVISKIRAAINHKDEELEKMLAELGEP